MTTANVEYNRSFGSAYRQWLQARTDVANVDAGGYDDQFQGLGDDDRDDRVAQINDRLTVACAMLVTMPALNAVELKQKIDAVITTINEREENGYPCDSRHRSLLASFQGDLTRWLQNLPPLPV